MHCHNCGNKLEEGAKFCKHCGTAVSEGTAAATTTAPIAGNHSDITTASTNQRLANLVLDYIGILVAGVIVGIILGIISGISGNETDTSKSYAGLGLIISVAYFIVFEAIWQRTPAKWITKTKVMRKDGGKPSIGQIIGRTLVRFIPFENFSYLFGGFPIGWHDRMSGTIVVPEKYTQEDIQKINFEELRKKKSDSSALIVVLVFYGLGVIVTIGIAASFLLSDFSTVKTSANDAYIKSNISSIRIEAENYWQEKNNYAGVCSSPEIVNNLAMVPTVNDIKPMCSDSEEEYAIYTELNSGSVYCVDSRGFADEVEIFEPGSTNCSPSMDIDTYDS